MNFFEELDTAVKNVRDCRISRLVLGWHASFVLAEDGRWGVGFVPDSKKEAHTARAEHTLSLIGTRTPQPADTRDGSAVHRAGLAETASLYVSPFPQEFAAATAACAALLPFSGEGLPLDVIMPCARGDRVAVLGYERDLVPFMHDWGWRTAFFDDIGRGPDCFPQEEFSRGVREAEWVWLSPEAIRDRWLLSTQDDLRQKKGCFMQGPGIPSLPSEAFSSLGVTHLLIPHADTSRAEDVEAHVSAGGSPWLCEHLIWRVH